MPAPPRLFPPTRRVLCKVALAALLAMAGAAAGDETPAVRLATTTSTDNSGLLDYLMPRFERDTGYAVQVISVGTGKALRLGESGDVDVLLVHAPRSERRFMAGGHGVERREVMANDFVIVGPRTDPAGLRRAASAPAAFRKIAQAAAPFVSRGDDSGTYKKELALWRAAGVGRRGAWHLEVGQGMGKALQIADELQGYLLIDRATWTFLRDTTTLQLLHEGDQSLHNPYGVMAVNPSRHATNFKGAMAFIDWLTSATGQAAIGSYTVRDTRLFIPVATPATNRTVDGG